MNQNFEMKFPEKRNRFRILLVSIQLLSIFLLSATPLHTIQQSDTVSMPLSDVATADELIYFTNLRRTQYGLPALAVNSILMSTAQQTADTMAGNMLSGHIGGVSSRIQDAGYGGGVTVWATENIASGIDTTAEELVYVIWNDDTHNIPVMNPIYCDIGAGVAVDSEGTSYFVLHAAYTDRHYCGEYIAPDGTTLETIYADQFSSGDNSETEEAREVSQYMQPVTRVTPNADGQIVHEVTYGQTLWSIAIAYGTKIKEIQAMNGMPEDDQTVYPGQILVIPTSLTPYPTEELTETPQPNQTVQLSPSKTNKPTRTSEGSVQTMETEKDGIDQAETEKAPISTIIFWIAVGGLLLILFGGISRFLPTEES